MERLPPELFFEVLQYLSLYTQRQCLQVCKSWHAIATRFANDSTSKVEFNSIDDVKNLVKELSSNPTRGLRIRQVCYKLSEDLSPIQELIKAFWRMCQNLAEFDVGNSIQLLQCLGDTDVQLHKLERIRSHSATTCFTCTEDGFRSAKRHRESLNQLVLITVLWFKQHRFLPVRDGTANYVHQFKNLKYLELTTVAEIVFDELIRACPQLQVMKLNQLGYLKVWSADHNNEQQNTVSDEVPGSQLEALIIDCGWLDRDLYEYLGHYCRNFSHLKVISENEEMYDSTLDEFSYLDPLPIFDAFDGCDPLPITKFTFEAIFCLVCPSLQRFIHWFPNLRELEVSGVPFDIDLDQLDIVHLSLNLTYCFINMVPSTIVIVVTNNNNTSWYKKEGSWYSESIFTRQEDDPWNHDLERKKEADEIVLITIEASSLNTIGIYFKQTSFIQTIYLDH